jgi:Domain of unknown function (DUF4173)
MRPTLQYPNRLLLVALGLGLCADYLFYGRWLGVSVALFVALGLAALYGLGRAEGRPPARANLWLGGAALFFALCVALRDTLFLAALDLLAALGLLLLVAAHYRGAALAELPGWRVLARALVAPAEISLRPAPLALQRLGSIRVGAEQTRRVVPVGRGLALALPVLTVFTGLLMAADSVFASYVLQLTTLHLPFDPGLLLAHLAIAGTTAWLYAGGALTALASGERAALLDRASTYAERLFGGGWGARQLAGELPAEGDTRPLPDLRRPLLALGWVEALTVLVAVDVLFGSFMLIQAAYFFGGLDTLDRTGMTYASYARRGFFELVAVACLALALLWGLALLARRERPWQRRSFNAACAALIALTFGMLASAFQRMLLYEQAYGYTRLRLYTHSFMIWLALVLGLFVLALLRDRPRLFTFGGFVSALAYLAALNLANPDALIVRENLARYQASGKLDASYLAGLSADATPDLVAALPMLDGASRATIEQALVWQRDSLTTAAAGQGWPAWSLPRARALAAIDGSPSR